MTVRELIRNLLDFDLNVEVDSLVKKNRFSQRSSLPNCRREIITRENEDYKLLEKAVYDEIESRELNGWHLEYVNRYVKGKSPKVCFEYAMYTFE